MFAGLAVVCDEYFVPALEVITEKLDVSDDVAGATLMAAGGSAPELATSIIGVFVAKSEVGFSTIVGSAVFNVLFVIGMCALFSREVLVLTGWPITRDSIYYSITLLVLAIFYQYGSEEKQIDGWEAAIMLVLYVGYVTLMKFNQTLKEWFYAKVVHKAKYKSAKVEVVSSKADDEEGDGMDDAESAAHRHGDKDIVRLGDGKPTTSFRNRRKFDARTRATTRFRAGVLDILMRDKSVVDTLRIQAVSGIIGDVRETFDEFDINGNGYIDSDELKNVLRDLLKMEPTDDQIKEAMNDLLTDRSEKAGGNEQISFEEFEQWYQFSELRVQAEMHSVFNEMDSEKDGMIDEAEFRLVLKKLHDKERDFTEDEIAHGLELFGGDDNKITFAEFCEWYKTTILYSHKLDDSKKEAHKAADAKAAGENEEDEEGVSLWPPASIRGRIVWLILLPINGPMFFTIPDVRWGHGWERLYILTFFLAILWIGVFSVFMVWWAIIIGDLIGVPQQVMGLVVLAAGTSIPDLFTSVIVARQGHGDMAVSSSIGSNIFDITMGLPIPWALYNIIKNEPIPLSPDGKIFFSLIVLLAMLASVIVTIILNKYRMTKTLGITMFVLYLVFIAQDLLRQAGVFTVNF